MQILSFLNQTQKEKNESLKCTTETLNFVFNVAGDSRKGRKEGRRAGRIEGRKGTNNILSI